MTESKAEGVGLKAIVTEAESCHVCCPKCQAQPQSDGTATQIARRQGGLPGGSKDWTHGLCGCLADPCLSLQTCFCYCIVMGKTHEKDTDDSCWIPCLLTLFLQPCTAWHYRGNVRDKRDIDGNVVFDFLAQCFCPCCAAVQERREVEAGGAAEE